MDYRKKYLNRTGFKSGSGILASAPWYRGTTGPSQILKAPRGFTGMQEILAGGILGTGASKFLEDEDKENLPVETEETKLPKKEPPEDPDILPELAKQTAEEVIRKEIKEKNKIQTWEKYMSRDEAEKAVKEGNITLKDLEIPALKKQITFRKTGDGFDILFDRKVVGELHDITQLKQEDDSQKGNEKTYNLSLINKDGYIGEAFDTLDGQAFAKDEAKSIVARDLLRDTEEPRYPSLKDIFQNIEYNKKGIPKKVVEELERIRKQIDKNKKAHGGLIDKPLPGGNRYI